MSGYDKVQKLREEVERFQNARFYSLGEDSTVIIENEVTGAIFDLPYEETEYGIIFDGENSECLKERSLNERDAFIHNSKALRDNFSALFEEQDYEDTIESIKSMVHELPTVSPEDISNSETISEEYEEYDGILADKVNEYIKIEEDFQKSLRLFDDDGAVVKSQVSISHYKELYEDTRAEWENFVTAIGKYHEFKELLQDDYSEEVCDVLLKSINIEDDITITAPKALVIAKNRLDEDINVITETKNVIDYFNIVFNEDGLNPDQAVDKLFNFAHKDSEKPRFLKFKMGVFTVEDAMTLASELDHAMSHIGDIDDEELGFIANQKEVLEYMIRTRKISDRMMQKLIVDFNERFTPKTREDEYIQSQLGFKDREERELANTQGKAERAVEAE